MPLALLRRQVLERPHVVEPVRQLHQHHADVVHHGQNHFAQVLRLLRFGAGKLDAADLGDALDDPRHLGSKFLAHAVHGDGRVLDDVVEHPSRQADDVEFHLRQNFRHFERMGDKGLPGKTLLRLVLVSAELVGLAQQSEIVGRTIGLNLAREFLERDHSLACSTGILG